MTHNSFHPIEIEIRIGVDGAITPLRFRIGQAKVSTWLHIAQISRRWSGDRGEHWLVMIAVPPRIYELVRGPEGLWQARAASDRGLV